MKFLLTSILGTLLLFSAMSVTTTSASDKHLVKTKSEVSACRFGQCKATAKSTGNRCKHCVSSSGDSYCYQHR